MTDIMQQINDARASFDKNMQAYEIIANERAEERMGQLHSQFVAFIAGSQLPLHEVLIVLQILVAEVIDQARERYLGG